MRATTLWAGRGLSARRQADEAFTASAATITSHGVTLFWDRADPANVQPAHSVFVVPIAPMALTPISRSLRSTSTVSGGSLQTALPSYWGPVEFRGGIRSLKLTPAATWTQVTVTKLTFNVQTQSVRASINGHAPVVFILVNEMGMTEHPFMSGGRTYVRIETRFAGSKAASNHRQRVAIGGTSRVCHGGVMRLWVRSGTLTVALILTLTVAACGAAASTTGGKPSPPPSRATPMPTSLARTAVLATPSFHLRRIATGLIQPLYVMAPPGDTHRLFIVEKTGEIVILRDGVRLAAPFLNISNLVSQASEQGLLCLAFDPHFAANHRLYVSYTDLSNNVRVVRYTVSSGDPDRASPASAKLLLAVPHPFTNHNGGQLAFGPDGLLYIGLGDGGSEGDPRLYGQNLHVLLAKILRMDESAARPRPSIYAYGLRNPWRFSFDQANGDLWIGDVGQDRWEEIDYLRAGTPAGTNFGWSYYEGNHVYKPQAIDRARLAFPVHEYSHAYGTSVIGGYVYRGKAIPTLRGWYLFADLSSRRVWLMRGPRGPVGLAAVSGQVGTVASFGEDASGELYLVSLNGQVYKIVR